VENFAKLDMHEVSKNKSGKKHPEPNTCGMENQNKITKERR
jgi:hypothetical protein